LAPLTRARSFGGIPHPHNGLYYAPHRAGFSSRKAPASRARATDFLTLPPSGLKSKSKPGNLSSKVCTTRAASSSAKSRMSAATLTHVSHNLTVANLNVDHSNVIYDLIAFLFFTRSVHERRGARILHQPPYHNEPNPGRQRRRTRRFHHSKGANHRGNPALRRPLPRRGTERHRRGLRRGGDPQR
jgi:hypothetical protein